MHSSVLIAEQYIDSAYEMYLANLNNEWKDLSWSSRLFSSQAKHKKTVEELRKICEQFKQTLSHKNATVHFVGIWYAFRIVFTTAYCSCLGQGYRLVCGHRERPELPGDHQRHEGRVRMSSWAIP